MINVRVPAGRRRLPFYLALEEWVAMHLPADDYFFTWIVSPTVICGRNQDIEKEVNIPYCREHGIDIVRRRSGGGCVFADLNNIMVSFITPSTEVQTTFRRLTDRVAEQLRRMGLDAVSGGRNDITIGERKISGNAFYHLPGRSIVHGTMLFDTDTAHMLNAITPSRAKLESNRVQSVQSRIVTAHELRPEWTLDQFHAQLVSGLETGRYELTAAEVLEVEAIEQNYYRPEWLQGVRATAAKGCRIGTASQRIAGVGSVTASVAIGRDGLMKGVSFTGDFFMDSDLDTEIISHLTGRAATEQAMAEALADARTSAISGLSSEALVSLLAECINSSNTESSNS
ncbi:MAG: lipoate--protein ligase [Muribaculaceae bacterium]|nr:lipoate--protein ligase [Muribaculaceae bacterium]